MAVVGKMRRRVGYAWWVRVMLGLAKKTIMSMVILRKRDAGCENESRGESGKRDNDTMQWCFVQRIRTRMRVLAENDHEYGNCMEKRLVRLFPMRFDFELHSYTWYVFFFYAVRFRASDFYFFNLKNESPSLLALSGYEKSDRIFFDLIIRWPKSSDFGPKSDGLGDQIFKSKNEMVSKCKYFIIHDSKQQQNDRWVGW